MPDARIPITILALLLAPTALAAAPTGGAQSARIGWVYRIEGHLDGQPVEYVGSAADLKQRLASGHQWTRLLRQDGTRVYAKEVFASLNIQASNRQTLMSARNEALRAAEQQALEELELRVAEQDRNSAPGQAKTKILNEIRASTNASEWRIRHRVTASERWQIFERSSTGLQAKALVLLTLLDAYMMYYNAKMSKYVMAPYILEDEQGLFTIGNEQKSWLSGHHYYKTYVSGVSKGLRIEMPHAEFLDLKAEAEALWGTTDLDGDFVPGLLNRELPRSTEAGIYNHAIQ